TASFRTYACGFLLRPALEPAGRACYRSEHGLDALADPSRDSQRRRLALRSWRRAGARWDGGGSLRPLLHQFRRFRRVWSGRGKAVLAPRARSRVRLASGHRPKIRPLRRRTRGYLHDDSLPRWIRARDRARGLARGNCARTRVPSQQQACIPPSAARSHPAAPQRRGPRFLDDGVDRSGRSSAAAASPVRRAPAPPPRCPRRAGAGEDPSAFRRAAPDCHAHLLGNLKELSAVGSLRMSSAQGAIWGVHNLKEWLDRGFTTVRDAGEIDAAYGQFALREGVAKGFIQGPRIHAAGGYVTVTGGHGDANVLAADQRLDRFNLADAPDAVAAVVRRDLKYGADWIKLMGTGGILDPFSDYTREELSDEQIARAVEVAHRAGRRVMVHAEGTGGIKAAVRAGADSIEHGTMLD